jgi:pimeloyl-ACP methyl ester carboxylesterase
MNSHTLLGLSTKGFHRIHYTEWGDASNPRIVICAHGLTRNGRDFDYLAQALERDFRVVCPDVAGRGRSDWLYAKEDYGYSQYLSDMTALIARVTAGESVKTLYWVGTSMGGIIGMLLAAQPQSPVGRLVLNDVGALVPKAALERIAAYVGKDPRFQTFQELESYVRTVSAPFGALTAEQWRHLTLHAAKQHADGTWGFCYDPGIAVAFQTQPITDVNLWGYWDRIACPTLLMRGAESDLLLREDALAMTERGPKPQLVEFPGIGHAPMLMAPDQIRVVQGFLSSN